MYQALYRKWRPKTFADVIGQEAVTQTLCRQVAEGRTSHAYLFTGTRGTGKTTCAKILAKAVNCEHPVDGSPCNECPSCLAAESGTVLDITEMDAASNNGVDNVRTLREEAIYPPAQLRRRVYIIDEVHMLTTQAFNALLKILEEPPEHLMFILATTELHKVPATILSRCQRFSFKRILPQSIAARLTYIAGEEKMDLRPDGAELLARLADGALRDGVSLLDQCAASGKTIDSTCVLETLGLAGNFRTAELMASVLKRDSAAALTQFGSLYEDGKDAATVIGELASLARDLLISVTAPKGGALLLSGGYDAETLHSLAALTSAPRLVQICSVLQAPAGFRRLDAELCLLRICDETLCGDLAAIHARLTRLESGVVTTPPPAPAPVSKPQTPPPAPVKEDVPWEETPPPVEDAPPVPEEEAPLEAPVEEEAPAPVEASAPANGDVFAELMDRYKERLPASKRSFLGRARGRLEDGVLTVCCSDDTQKDFLDKPEVIEVLKEVTEAAVGREITVRFILGTMPDAPTHDKMQDLLKAGKKLENFTVK